MFTLLVVSINGFKCTCNIRSTFSNIFYFISVSNTCVFIVNKETLIAGNNDIKCCIESARDGQKQNGKKETKSRNEPECHQLGIESLVGPFSTSILSFLFPASTNFHLYKVCHMLHKDTSFYPVGNGQIFKAGLLQS